MARRKIMAAALAAMLALTGCSRHEGGEPVRNDVADTAAAAEAIRAEEAQWNRDYAARDVDAIVAHFAADGIMAGPGSAPLSGTQAIGAVVRSMVADPAFQLEFAADRVEVASSGDLGYSRGRFALTSTDLRTRRPQTMRGTYLTVWRKQADGSWKAVEDVIVPGPPTR